MCVYARGGAIGNGPNDRSGKEKLGEERHAVEYFSECIRGRQEGSARRAIGNSIEWYDFAVYGYFATIIVTQFFPSENRVASLLATFAVFAVAFLCVLSGLSYSDLSGTGWAGEVCSRRR